MNYLQPNGRYPNQPPHVSNKAWDLATGIAIFLTHDKGYDFTLADTLKIAEAIDREYPPEK